MACCREPGLTADELQPIPITTRPTSEDSLLVTWGNSCPSYHALQVEDQGSQAWTDNYNAKKPVLDALAQLLDITITQSTEVTAATT